MYTGRMPRDRVRVTVRFGRIIRMQKMAGTGGTKEEISLDYNDSITDQEHFAQMEEVEFLHYLNYFHGLLLK